MRDGAFRRVAVRLLQFLARRLGLVLLARGEHEALTDAVSSAEWERDQAVRQRDGLARQMEATLKEAIRG